MIPIKRNYYNLLNNLLDLFPAVVLLGARQTGKTTLAKQLRPDWYYVDLENPNDFQRISADPDLFFQQHPENIIFDEAQSYPLLFNVLRGVIDRDPTRKGRFMITGSSSPEVSHHVSESLAGRIAIMEIGTLKANECCGLPLSPFYDLFTAPLTRDKLVQGKSPISDAALQRCWLRGGYPEPVLSDNALFYQHWMQNYYATYINRDVAGLFPKLNKIKYQQFIKMLSRLSGTIINKSDVGRALEVSEGTAREYLRVAEGTYLWRELLSYESSAIKSIVKMPKGYVRDSGLLHYFMGIDTLDSLYVSPSVGFSFESFVIDELLKGMQAKGITNYQARYFRTRKGVEVDLVLSGYFGVLPIEIKYGSQTVAKQVMNLQGFIQQEGLDFGMVINQSKEPRWITDQIIEIPATWL
jgi:predicted AAA+ superfamily ATPase